MSNLVINGHALISKTVIVAMALANGLLFVSSLDRFTSNVLVSDDECEMLMLYVVADVVAGLSKKHRAALPIVPRLEFPILAVVTA